MRVRIVAGPWPERIGCVGTIVAAPPGYDRYPWHGLDTKYEAIVLLDDDPLWRPQDPDDYGGQSWSFAIDRMPASAQQPNQLRAADATYTTTLRLPMAVYEQVQLVARAEDKSVSGVIREAIAEHVARRRADPEFQARLRERIKNDATVLRRLAAPAQNDGSGTTDA